MAIWEIAEIVVAEGKESTFEEGVRQAQPLLLSQPGCSEVKLERSIEEPQVYLVRIVWDTVEAHTEGFRKSPAFQEWRSFVGHCFASPPQVRHTAAVEL